MRTRLSRSCRGFTIIELLAATALVALLMTALLSVIASIGRSRATFESVAKADGWHDGLAEVVRRDLAAASEVQSGTGGLTITGNGAIDRSTGLNTHRSATVKYEVVLLDDRRWLVRTQRMDEGGAGGGARWVEPLCPDVVDISVEPMLSDARESKGAAAEGMEPTAEPVAFRVRVISALPAGLPFDRVILVR